MKDASRTFQRFLDIVRTLRGPNGCPWDKEQTPQSLRTSLLEEAYECIDAIDRDDNTNLSEELGDLLLLVTMISYMKEQEQSFTVSEMIENISEKLVRRHPHVFGKNKLDSSQEVLEQWDYIKDTIEKKGEAKGRLDSIPASFPSLERSFHLQKKAAKYGFDWQNIESVQAKVEEELQELSIAVEQQSVDSLEEEIGDLLFAIINLSRHHKIDPAIALNRTNTKFIKRFQYIEREMAKLGIELSSSEFDRMDRLWEESKTHIEKTPI